MSKPDLNREPADIDDANRLIEELRAEVLRRPRFAALRIEAQEQAFFTEFLQRRPSISGMVYRLEVGSGSETVVFRAATVEDGTPGVERSLTNGEGPGRIQWTGPLQ